MDSARQILRWSIPGLVFVLNVVVVHGIWILVVDEKSPWGFINQATAPALVAVVAGGLPAGFLLYQFYFHGYRPHGAALLIYGKPVGPRFYRKDRGGAILSHYRYTYSGRRRFLRSVDPEIFTGVTPQDVFTKIDLVITGKRPLRIFGKLPYHLVPSRPGHLPGADDTLKCAVCIDEYTRRTDRNWILVQTMIDSAAAKNRGWIKREYTSGSDLFHALGASRTAVWIAVLTATLYQLAITLSLHTYLTEPGIAKVWPIFVALAAFFVLATAEMSVLRVCRDQLSVFYDKRIAAALAMVSRLP